LSLHDNYHRVLENIAAACAKAGRAAEDVHLIAVSKTHPVTEVEEIATLGQKDFAENRIGELVDKQKGTRISGIHWHLIGQLQTNKVKLLTADMILHSLDRNSLAEKLQQQFGSEGEKIRTLIQVNCSHEANKSGVSIPDFDALVEMVARCPSIDVLGLMTMAENTTDEKTIRSAFSRLRELSERLKSQGIFGGYQGMLSMGMSGDYEHAIAEGATHVRIGSAIFGSR
jgi:PLP dependent protein